MAKTPTNGNPAPEQTPADLIGRYVDLRDQRKAADARFAEWRKEHFDSIMDGIEMKLLDSLNQSGADSIKTKKGTAYKKTATSVTTADGAAFQRHVIGLEAWELVDFRPNKTAINDLIEAGEPLPPGLNRTQVINVLVNRPKE